ncbi:hypothetical protein Tco_1515071 [Tanacetum coccineum]
MHILFAPTGWCRITKAPHCSIRKAQWCFDSPCGLVENNLLKYGVDCDTCDQTRNKEKGKGEIGIRAIGYREVVLSRPMGYSISEDPEEDPIEEEPLEEPKEEG